MSHNIKCPRCGNEVGFSRIVPRNKNSKNFDYSCNVCGRQFSTDKVHVKRTYKWGKDIEKTPTMIEKEHMKETLAYKLGYENGARPPHHLFYEREMKIPFNSFSNRERQVPQYIAGWQDGRRVSESAGKLKDGFFIVGETKTGYTLRNNRGEKEIAKDELKYYKDYTN